MSPEDLLKMLDLGGSESTPPAESVIHSDSIVNYFKYIVLVFRIIFH